MKKTSTAVFDLIHALSKAEKRYFKVYVARFNSEKGLYEKLFDAIASQSSYDEDAILAKPEFQSSARQFSIVKNRLYQAICKSLNSYHTSGSIDAQIRRQLHIVEILYNKSLYTQAKRILRSARKQAEKYERVLLLLEVSKLEKKLLEHHQYSDLKKGDLKRIRQEENLLMDRVNYFNKVWNVKSKVLRNLYETGTARSQDEIDKMESLIKGLPKSSPDATLNVMNTFLYNHLRSAYYFGIRQEEKSHPYLVKNFEIIQASPQLFEDKPTRVLSTLTNLIHVSEKLGHVKDVELYIEKLEKLPSKMKEADKNLEVKIFALTRGLELERHIRNKNYPEGFKLVERIETGLVAYGSRMSDVRKAVFYFNIAVLYYQAGRLNEALKWVHQLTTYLNIPDTLDIYCMARILHLLIHLDLDNESIIPNILQSTKRFLSTRKRVYEFERIILEFVNRLHLPSRNQTESEMYEELFQELKPLKDDPFERRVFEFYDWLNWAEKRRLAAFKKGK